MDPSTRHEIELARRMTPDGRFRESLALCDRTFRLMQDGIRHQFLQATPDEVLRNYDDPAAVESDGGPATLEQISFTQELLQTGPAVSPPEAGIRTMQQLRLSGTITLPEVEVQTGVPQILSLFLYSAASASGFNTAAAHAGTLGSHTFGPAFGVPVVNLEPGVHGQFGVDEDCEQRHCRHLDSRAVDVGIARARDRDNVHRSSEADPPDSGNRLTWVNRGQAEQVERNLF